MNCAMVEKKFLDTLCYCYYDIALRISLKSPSLLVQSATLTNMLQVCCSG